MQELCDKLNKLIFEKKDGFLDEVNKIIYELYQKGGEMYWNREVWIDHNCDEKKCKDLVRYTDKVMFVPSDDPEEHPGIVVHYKNK